MCYAVLCARCGGTTWDGCGAHVDEVMSGVSEAQRCRCDGEPAPLAAPPASTG